MRLESNTHGRFQQWCYTTFGSTITERSASFGAKYRYGFNNQEQDGELGDYYAFEYRIHDARLGRFLSVDPLAPEYPWNSCYAFAENRVIDCLDLEGLEAASGTVMMTGGTGAVKSPNQHTVYGKTTATQRINQQSFLQSELNKLTGSEWKPANGKYDQAWFDNIYKPNAAAINVFLDKPASQVATNPTQSSATVTSTPSPSSAPVTSAPSSAASVSTTTSSTTSASEILSTAAGGASTSGVVLGAVETVDRFGYVTSAGSLKSFGTSSSKLLVSPKIVEKASIGKLTYIKNVDLSELAKEPIVSGPQKIVAKSLARTGLTITVGKALGPLGAGLSVINAFSSPTDKNIAGAAFDLVSLGVGVICPPAGFAISAIGWTVGQLWPEPTKPTIVKRPTPIYPKPSPPQKYSTSSSVIAPYKYTESYYSRWPSDRNNSYSPAGLY
jgi:RHS repeat-associated protein